MEENIIAKLRLQIGDTDTEEPNISDEELKNILENAASEYSRIKGYIKFYETQFKHDENIYELPEDCYKVKEAKLKEQGYKLKFIDNMNQIIFEDDSYAQDDTLKITYIKYFSPEEIDKRELDIFMILSESLCYKLMASKTAEFIKFSTGEKSFDESGISKKYLELYDKTFKNFKSKIVKAYGKRANNIKPDLKYNLDFPPEGEII